MSIHAIVKRGLKTRKGKGFSKAELKAAGLSVNDAFTQCLPLDLRRSTSHEENVKMLVPYTQKMEPTAPTKKVAKTAKTKARAALEEIEGIGSTYAKKLLEAGITTTDDLLEAGTTPKDRENLAQKTGISEKLILEWVNLADLFRIKGVGEEYSDLLDEAGVDTVVELSQRVAENLHATILEVNEKKKLVRRPPTLRDVTAWIKQAKTLPRKIEY